MLPWFHEGERGNDRGARVRVCKSACGVERGCARACGAIGEKEALGQEIFAGPSL